MSFVLRFYQAAFPLETAQPVTLILPLLVPGRPLSAESVSTLEEALPVSSPVALFQQSPEIHQTGAIGTLRVTVEWPRSSAAATPV